MKKRNLFILLAVVVLLATTLACASGNPYASSEYPAGFWKGLWDGMTSGISWIISLFNPGYGIYEVHNNGGWYNFGFILGIGGPIFTASSASSRRK